MKSIRKKKNITPIKIDQLDVLSDRSKLREFCIQNNIKTPDFFCSDQFLKISQWAMKKNSFPLCLKSSRNLSNYEQFYILKAFRELPEFFESIQSKTNNEKVIIEEFIEGKAYIEVTFFNGSIRLISQIGLNKSMKLQQKWRAFPIKLPDGILGKILEITHIFNKIILESNDPIRFSFAIKNMEPVLLSINSDNNRLEYLNEWRKQGELEPLGSSSYPSVSDNINKISIYKIPKDKELDLLKSVNACKKTKVKYEIIGNKLYYMLTSDSFKNLTDDFEIVNAIIKQELQK